MIGASTGGPQALTRAARARCPPTSRVPVVVALHIPPGYTEAFAAAARQRVARSTSSRPRRAARCAPAARSSRARGYHLKRRAARDERPRAPATCPVRALHRPSVDVLFESAAAVSGPRARRRAHGHGRRRLAGLARDPRAPAAACSPRPRRRASSTACRARASRRASAAASSASTRWRRRSSAGTQRAPALRTCPRARARPRTRGRTCAPHDMTVRLESP